MQPRNELELLVLVSVFMLFLPLLIPLWIFQWIKEKITHRRGQTTLKQPHICQEEQSK